MDTSPSRAETLISSASSADDDRSPAAPVAATPDSTPPPREQFIMLRKPDLVAAILADARNNDHERKRLVDLCDMLAAVLHHEYHARLESLKDAFAPFDPDGGVPVEERQPSDRRDAACNALFDQVVALFERANYRRLTRADLDEALGTMSEVGVRLDVDLATFQRLEVFVRGDVKDRRRRRGLSSMYREREIEVPSYQRLVVAFHPRETKRMGEHARPHHVYLKMFKNIPKMDLDMLLPGTRVKMSLFDQGRILLPAVSGVAFTIYKILQGALVIAFAGMYSILAFLGVVGGTLGYGVKSFIGYLRTKDKHQLYLTRSLYFQNLDNNVGVIFRILDEAEEQDFREALLAYFHLWRGAADGMSLAELDADVETFLRDRAKVDVDFEVDDALVKLQMWDLVEPVGNDRFRAKPLEEAILRLDERWDAAYRHREGGTPL